ncbi:putative membrane protein [Collimonas arenae]|uniref:Putative membrane protein n=1 Tax=Collimonas arenae TaxID=279058 RepID=A0A127PM14_9BURK|nr:putative membrane protein [Collimonas arenae]AMP08700.1 putative membrane protein [Collimonas arenae]
MSNVIVQSIFCIALFYQFIDLLMFKAVLLYCCIHCCVI